MPDAYQYTVAQRFLEYVKIDTQSDPESQSQPSTAKQKNLSTLLVKELQAMGISDAHLDEHGYVYATIPSNSDKNVPTICYCAHVDTSPDCSGANVKPIVHQNYDGRDIVLPDDHTQVISISNYPYLETQKGNDIITASGTTLLGADDKAGVVVIMDLANYLIAHPEVKHGAIKILFTPDEEIGRGVNKVDIKKLGAEFGYTLDGSELGSFEDETFSADGVLIEIYGVSTHPGDAKDKMVNAIKIAAEFIEDLPKDSYSPETTAGKEGFFHPVRMSGSVEKTSIEFIIRDFHTYKLQQYENYLKDKLEVIVAKYPGAHTEFKVQEQYRNMKEVLDDYPKVCEYAREAITRAGVTVVNRSARGGTDGSRLSFMGLPCPNIFTGEMAFHGKHEFVSIQDMQKSVDTIIELAKIWEERS
ncbi:MAG: peptidase T [Chitinophagaceae bacterium]|nr:peptidase T [Chitinophagaceae bacterium]